MESTPKKFLDFMRCHPFSLLSINLPILILLNEYFAFRGTSQVIFIFFGSFTLMIFEDILLSVLKPKTKPKSTEELIDDAWFQNRKEKRRG